jgi:hypothetical protein
VLNSTAYRTLILHWNGTAWKRVQSPNTGDASTDNMLFGIAAHGADDLWAVDRWSQSHLPTKCLGGRRGEHKNLVLHWNGRSWKKVQVQNPGTVENIFYDIDALSANEIWMVGSLATRRTSSTRPARAALLLASCYAADARVALDASS